MVPSEKIKSYRRKGNLILLIKIKKLDRTIRKQNWIAPFENKIWSHHLTRFAEGKPFQNWRARMDILFVKNLVLSSVGLVWVLKDLVWVLWVRCEFLRIWFEFWRIWCESERSGKFWIIWWCALRVWREFWRIYLWVLKDFVMCISILIHPCPVLTSLVLPSWSVQPCPVLYMSSLVQLCPALSSLVLPCPALFRLVQPCPAFSNLVQPCPALSSLVQFCPALSSLVLSNPFQTWTPCPDLVQPFPVLSNLPALSLVLI